MLVMGGVLDQPAGEFQAAIYAGYIDYFWRQMSTKDWKPETDGDAKLLDEINAIRVKLLTNG